MNVEHIIDPSEPIEAHQLRAIIVRTAHQGPEGATFFTDPKEPLQVGYLRYGKGVKVPPHIHYNTTRTIHQTQEVLVVVRGWLTVEFYSDRLEFLETRDLMPGDVLIILRGGHGFKSHADAGAEVVEVKTGPYMGRQHDKAPILR